MNSLKIQPKQIELPTFSSSSGDFSFVVGEDSIKVTEIVLTDATSFSGDLDFESGLFVSGKSFEPADFWETGINGNISKTEIVDFSNIHDNLLLNTDQSSLISGSEKNLILNAERTVVNGKSNSLVAGSKGAILDGGSNVVLFSNQNGKDYSPYSQSDGTFILDYSEGNTFDSDVFIAGNVETNEIQFNSLTAESASISTLIAEGFSDIESASVTSKYHANSASTFKQNVYISASGFLSGDEDLIATKNWVTSKGYITTGETSIVDITSSSTPFTVDSEDDLPSNIGSIRSSGDVTFNKDVFVGGAISGLDFIITGAGYMNGEILVSTQDILDLGFATGDETLIDPPITGDKSLFITGGLSSTSSSNQIISGFASSQDLNTDYLEASVCTIPDESGNMLSVGGDVYISGSPSFSYPYVNIYNTGGIFIDILDTEYSHANISLDTSAKIQGKDVATVDWLESQGYLGGVYAPNGLVFSGENSSSGSSDIEDCSIIDLNIDENSSVQLIYPDSMSTEEKGNYTIPFLNFDSIGGDTTFYFNGSNSSSISNINDIRSDSSSITIKPYYRDFNNSQFEIHSPTASAEGSVESRISMDARRIEFVGDEGGAAPKNSYITKFSSEDPFEGERATVSDFNSAWPSYDGRPFEVVQADPLNMWLYMMAIDVPDYALAVHELNYGYYTGKVGGGDIIEEDDPRKKYSSIQGALNGYLNWSYLPSLENIDLFWQAFEGFNSKGILSRIVNFTNSETKKYTTSYDVQISDDLFETKTKKITKTYNQDYTYEEYISSHSDQGSIFALGASRGFALRTVMNHIEKIKLSRDPRYTELVLNNDDISEFPETEGDARFALWQSRGHELKGKSFLDLTPSELDLYESLLYSDHQIYAFNHLKSLQTEYTNSEDSSLILRARTPEGYAYYFPSLTLDETSQKPLTTFPYRDYLNSSEGQEYSKGTSSILTSREMLNWEPNRKIVGVLDESWDNHADEYDPSLNPISPHRAGGYWRYEVFDPIDGVYFNENFNSYYGTSAELKAKKEQGLESQLQRYMDNHHINPVAKFIERTSVWDSRPDLYIMNGYSLFKKDGSWEYVKGAENVDLDPISWNNDGTPVYALGSDIGFGPHTTVKEEDLMPKLHSIDEYKRYSNILTDKFFEEREIIPHGSRRDLIESNFIPPAYDGEKFSYETHTWELSKIDLKLEPFIVNRWNTRASFARNWYYSVFDFGFFQQKSPWYGTERHPELRDTATHNRVFSNTQLSDLIKAYNNELY